MKKTKNIMLKQLLFTVNLGIFTLGLLSILCLPQMIANVDAQGQSYHTNTHHGIANLAEKESRIKEEERKADTENKNDKIEHTANVTVTNENTAEPLNSPEITYSYDELD